MVVEKRMPFATFHYAMLSDPGRVRRNNQDACAADAMHGIFVVCDGVGGAAGGEIASRLAAESFLSHLTQVTRSGSSLELDIHQAIDYANQRVHEQTESSPELRGMATTMVALLFNPAEESGICLANIGDSRAYRLRRGSLEQLTADHSVVEEQVRAGSMTREEADVSPIRNLITRAIGTTGGVQADVQCLTVEAGDLYLLTSDGLMRELSDAEILRMLVAAPVADNDALAALCRQLVDAANAKGGGDNITCLLVYFP
jgi:protein phosphatase